MRNRKVILVILSIIILLIIFIASYIISSQRLNKFQDNIIEVNKDIQDNIKNGKKQEKNNQEKFFQGKILSIEGRNIIVENPSHLVDYSIYEGDMKYHNEHKVIADDKLCVTASYLLCLDTVTIRDGSGNKIDVLDLKIGDILKVYTKNLKYNESIVFMPITSEYIELIEKI